MKRPLSSYFLRILIFGCLISSIPVIIVGIFSYIKSSELIQHNVQAYKLQQLFQIQTNVEQVMKTVDHSLTYFVNSSFLKSVIQEPLTIEQFQLYNQIKQEINHLQTFDTGIENMVLLSNQQHWYISNSGLYHFKPADQRDRLLRYFELEQDSAWIVSRADQTAIDGPFSASCAYSIQLVKQIPLNADRKTGLAIVSIPSCYISLLTYNNTNETVLIIDNNDQVILQDNAELLYDDDPSYISLLQQIRSAESGAHPFETMLNGTSYTVTFTTSEYNGWTYVSVIAMSELTQQSRSIGWFTIIICLCMLALGLLTAWFGSTRIYRPVELLYRQAVNLLPARAMKPPKDGFEYISEQIQAVVQAKSALELKLQSQVEQLQTLFMLKLYEGKISAKTVGERLQTFGYPTDWRRFTVMALRIDSLEGTKYEAKDTDLLLFAMNNITEELIPPEKRFTPIVNGPFQITLLLTRLSDSDLENDADSIYKTAESVQQTIMNVLHLTVSIGLASLSPNLSQVRQVYQESIEAVKHSSRFGAGSIVFYKDLPQKYAVATYFPVRIQNELHDAIKLADREKADERLDEWFQHLNNRHMSPQDVELWIARAVIDFVHLAHSLGIHNVEFADNTSLFDHMFRHRSMNELRGWIRASIIEPIISAIEERTESQYKNISEQIIDFVNHEFDTDLSLESIAARLHYNANYISSVFRKETGVSFSEYLSAYRHRMAVHYLVETKMSVKEIAEKLQYNNSQNFIRFFRKVEGITPGKYRELHVRNS